MNSVCLLNRISCYSVYQQLMKGTLDSKKIIFYYRYVDDNLIIYDQNHINKDDIQNYINKIHPDLKFKATDKIVSTINFLDLLITRRQNKLSINTVYTKKQLPQIQRYIINLTTHYSTN